MKQTKNTSRKNNMLLFILVSICAIIFIVIRTIADDNLNKGDGVDYCNKRDSVKWC